MSQAKLRQARSLIQKKQYDEARAILETLDDPQARKWLAQIDKQQPGSSRSRTSRRQGGGGCARIVGYGLTLIVSALLTLALIGAMVIVTAPSRAEQNVMRATEAVLAVTATVQAALPTVTSTPTPVPVTGVVSAPQSVNVRSGPSLTSAAIAALIPGTRIDLLSRSDDGNWYYVRMSNGQEGWLASDLVSAEGEVPTSVAEVPTVTAAPSDVCTTEEAQAWYDAQRPTLNQVKFLLMQLQGAKSGSGSFDYPANLPVIQDYRNKIESAEGLGCLSEVRSQLAAGLKAFENSLANQINGFPNESTSEMNVAVESFANADNLLKIDLGVQVSLNDCGAEVWYSGVADQISAFLTTTDGITVDTGASEEIRNAIFDLQDIRRNITVTAPECVSTATSHLFASVDAGIGLLQAIMSSDSEDKRRQITIMTRERDAFFQEMNALNIPVEIQ